MDVVLVCSRKECERVKDDVNVVLFFLPLSSASKPGKQQNPVTMYIAQQQVGKQAGKPMQLIYSSERAANKQAMCDLSSSPWIYSSLLIPINQINPGVGTAKSRVVDFRLVVLASLLWYVHSSSLAFFF
jgi:hypothetical protein